MENAVIGESYEMKSIFLKKERALEITSSLESMNATVHFNNQTTLNAAKIHNVFSQSSLTSEFVSQFFLAKKLPENFFGSRHITPQALRLLHCAVFPDENIS